MNGAASYFDDPRHAKALRLESLSWIGTPFRPFSIAKGPGGGIDCIGLVSEIFTAIGATGKWNFPRVHADYENHQLGDKVLDWLRGKGSRAALPDSAGSTASPGRSGCQPDSAGSAASLPDPQSTKLSEILTELEIPDAVTDRDTECPRDFFKPGDILVMRHGGLFHMPVIYDNDLHIISAIPRMGVIEGTIQDSSYSSHLVAAFRLKPITDH